MVQDRITKIWTRSSHDLVVTRERYSLMEIVHECSCVHARDAGDPCRILGDNRVICEAISVHDTSTGGNN